MVDIKKYVPECYKEVIELDAIYDAENVQLEECDQNTKQVCDNYFVQTCDESTIADWEQTLNLAPLETDTLEIRRQKVLFMLGCVPPYTDIFLHELLRKYANGYTLKINSSENEIQIIVVENDIALVNFLKQLLIGIIPAHISFEIFVGAEYDIDANQYYGCAVSCGTIYDVGV